MAWILPLFLLMTAAGRGKPPKEIRVLIGEASQALLLEGTGLKAQSSRRKISARSGKIELTVSKGKLVYKGKDLGASVKVTGSGPVSLNGHSYPGMLRIEKSGDKFLIVNVLSVESYLEGVVRNEMSVKWPLEALKAQTVLARTYALEKISQPRSEKYDLVASVEDQVYTGVAERDPASQQAIRETEGEVLYYRSELAEVFYHSCCGGQTESAEYVWTGVGRPYLQSIKCDHCQECPYFFWRFPDTGVLGPEELAARLGYQGEAVEEISIAETSPSQRALKLKVRFKGGHIEEISGSDFRLRLGREGVRSTFFRVQKEPSGFIIFGSGSGHGVGLCQWGAKGMAEQGKKYRELLEFYFPGTELKKICQERR